MRLEGKVALVTGATGGIGAAISKRFASEGAKIVATDLDAALGAQLVEEISEAGGEAFFRVLDVTSEAHWTGALAETMTRFGKIDILINNAGIFQHKELVDITGDEWDRVMNTNAKGTFFGAKAAIPHMCEAGGGAIVNMSSIAGIRGAAGSPHYGASKGAVRLLTRAMAQRYARDGIRCNSLHPGPIETDMGYAAWPESVRESRLAAMPMRRYGRPDEIANAALFLASDEASYMTGAEMIVDGGTTA
jgi:NAD(P)-dependent dehydrogenase (short-subunit alcohol dehydrogenase family)